VGGEKITGAVALVYIYPEKEEVFVCFFCESSLLRTKTTVPTEGHAAKVVY
jgi:hypothetical protein